MRHYLKSKEDRHWRRYKRRPTGYDFICNCFPDGVWRKGLDSVTMERRRQRGYARIAASAPSSGTLDFFSDGDSTNFYPSISYQPAAPSWIAAPHFVHTPFEYVYNINGQFRITWRLTQTRTVEVLFVEVDRMKFCNCGRLEYFVCTVSSSSAPAVYNGDFCA